VSAWFWLAVSVGGSLVYVTVGACAGMTWHHLPGHKHSLDDPLLQRCESAGIFWPFVLFGLLIRAAALAGFWLESRRPSQRRVRAEQRRNRDLREISR
jgi:hypothetical protein